MGKGSESNVPIGSGQACSTQGVAAPWIAALFAVVHWQAISVAEQDVTLAVASARHFWAHSC